MAQKSPSTSSQGHAAPWLDDDRRKGCLVDGGVELQVTPVLAIRAQAPSNPERVDTADAVLRRAVLAHLVLEPLISRGDIAVEANAGRVTLAGYVTSNAQKDAAHAAVRRIEGVEQVVDDLKVAVPCPTWVDPCLSSLAAQPSTVDPRWFKPFDTERPNDTGALRPELRP